MAGINRRRVLQSGTAMTAIGVLGACAGEPGTTESEEPIEAETPPIEATPVSYTAEPIPDGLEQLEMLANGSATALSLTEDAIARSKATHPMINAIATETYDKALETAETPREGSFGGVPTFIKDLLNWEGDQTLYGSRAFQGYIAPDDAPFAAAWRKAGMISLGKSTSPEMGLISSTEPLVTGATRNPYDLSRIPGGSSGGAAALVAARVVPFAHASDGGGSIRIPAACCGLFGLKPSRGALPISRDSGPVDISVNHAVTLTVRDSAALFAAAEVDLETDLPRTGNITEASARRLRIAYAPDPITNAVLDAETRSGIERTAQLCRDLGHEVIDFAMPADGARFTDAFLLYWAAGAATFAQQASDFSGKPIGPDIVEPWTLSLAADFLARQAEMPETIAYLQAFEAEYHAWFDDFDVLLTPTVSTVAPKVGEQAPDGDYESVRASVLNFAAFTAPMNVSGAASMSVPLQWSNDGLPIGSMFSGKRGDDSLLLALAYELEAAMPWIDRLPSFTSSE
ncbi:MAG: amidase family protein [Pseudomonadota bacterium]